MQGTLEAFSPFMAADALRQETFNEYGTSITGVVIRSKDASGHILMQSGDTKGLLNVITIASKSPPKVVKKSKHKKVETKGYDWRDDIDVINPREFGYLHTIPQKTFPALAYKEKHA